ncbi:TetR/AcrR family transcriptional regulator [Actinomadura rubrisoli]|uniref:TetR/AcrR family transcriptional regulator n=1 Tax=Actinomadura rubrisoli TaxID=2530368 RepID=A0A4R5C1Z9_9ACTN|nr:TetR/AcrR family transcriptional regulator [Actinomadura rubrisoli]TDD93628.1 TetR/AcrR family transcriptional regulator [Actinomadura rubrisoli]
MAGTGTAEGGTRADAVRNRRLLLDAAAAEFAEHGMDVPIARIAARAGVGKGTVFRHFATKEQLLAAIFGHRLDELSAVGQGLLDARDPGAALLAFMTEGVRMQAGDRMFCQAVTALARTEPQLRAASERLIGVAEALTARARRAGSVREDATGHDVVLLLGAATQAAAPLGGTLPGLWRRYVHMIFDGLRPGAAHPLPEPPPTTAQLAAAAKTSATS